MIILSPRSAVKSQNCERTNQNVKVPYFYNRYITNRHVDCQGEVYDKRDLSNASNDNQLLKPETVR